MFITRYFAAAIVSAFAFAACSGSPQQAGLPSTPQSGVARAAVPFTSPIDALGLTPDGHRHKKRAHGVPDNCTVNEYSESSNVQTFAYHKNEPAGSYTITWVNGTKIDTIDPAFTFYNSPNGTGGVVDSFSGPYQNPTITGGTGGWTEYDVQPDYDPTGSKSMLFQIWGTNIPSTVKAWVIANFNC